jgi:hypothetical protein
MEWLEDWWWLAVIAAALYGLHRLACALEDRGFINYRHPSPRGTALALMNYHSLFEPAVAHVVEYQRSGDLTLQTSSEPGPGKAPEEAAENPPTVDAASNGHHERDPDLTTGL